MQLKLYNTLTRTKEVFEPLDAARVRMYVCGPTVYDFAHIGNARPVIVFDVLYRLLRHLYGPDHVKYVRNVTDVDDKINARAAERGISIRELTEETYNNFKEDVAALGCLPPSVEPRATEYIPQMIKMIGELIQGGYAYSREGHVLFDVSKKRDYGKLSNRSVDEMIAGSRVEVAPYKKGPMDFVLWKPSPPDLPGWESPWGRGRPGWHIECSAMSDALLGRTFDIHGGGIDLVFPHHENEIAQSECAHHGAPLAQIWMHNNFLQVEGEKMSKSLGNIITIRELLKNWPSDAVRFNMLDIPYLQPIKWAHNNLMTALNELRSWSELIFDNFGDANLSSVEGEVDDEVLDTLKDDLNTRLAFAKLRGLFERAKLDQRALRDFVKTLSFLGFWQLNKPGYFHAGFVANTFDSGTQIGLTESRQIHFFKTATANGYLQVAKSEANNLEEKGFNLKLNDAGVLFVENKTSADTFSEIETLVAERNRARSRKDWKESDRIRDKLEKMGVELKDNKDGTTTWEVAR